jgi:hypothetical protein
MAFRRFSTAVLKDCAEIFGQHYVTRDEMYSTGVRLATGAVALDQLFTGFQNSWLAASIKQATDERFDTLNKKMDDMAMRLPPAEVRGLESIDTNASLAPTRRP